jgi:two-component system, OmpR family, sensor histidine kinase KdpD
VRPTGQRSVATGILVAVGSVALVTALIYPLKEVMPVVSTSVLYLLPVLLVAGYWGLWLALPTAVVSALAWNFFHIPPTGRFTIEEEENWVALAVFLVAAVVVSALAAAGRSRTEEAERRRSEADLLAEMGRILLGSGSVEESLRAVGQRIARAFDLPSVTIELAWVDSDERRRALPLIVGGSRTTTTGSRLRRRQPRPVTG